MSKQFLSNVVILAALAGIMAICGASATTIVVTLALLVSGVWLLGKLLTIIVEATFRAVFGAVAGKR